MKVKGLKTVRLSTLHTNLFVRKELNQDHVLYLAELIENGVEMNDPIEVVENDKGNIVIDGRHRKEAYELNGVEATKVRVLIFEDEAEMIAYAFKKNAGGSLPPSAADTEHVIMLLFERGETQKKIAERLGLPTTLVRKYIQFVRSKIARQKIQKAISAVVDCGLTIAQAAQKYEVEINKLKDALSGRRKKQKQGLPQVKSDVTRSHKSLSSRNAALMRNLFEKYEDGDLTESQVNEIFAQIQSLQKRAVRTLSDWQKRFTALCQGKND